jgi:hypothetical protein
VLSTQALASTVITATYTATSPTGSVTPAGYTYDGVTFAGAFNGPTCCAANSFVDGADNITFNASDFSVVGTPSLGLLVSAAIPEPMTWIVMLLGLGGLGAALRVQRRAPAA